MNKKNNTGQAKRAALQYFVVIFIALFVLEVGLEGRHYLKGYSTLFFGKREPAASRASDRDTVSRRIYGPSISFPFKSRLPESGREYEIEVWIASASHAEGGNYPARQIFPNLICDAIIKETSCLVINGSRAGIGILQNVDLMESFFPDFNIDYVILYQLSQVVAGQLSEIDASDTATNVAADAKPSFTEWVAKVLQKTALFGHLSDYLSGNIKLQGRLHDEMPSWAVEDFREQLKYFVDSARESEAKPVLMTFAASHTLANLDSMPRNIRTNFVRYSSYLSPVGWVRTVSEYNSVIRQFSAEEGVDLIDLAEILNGESKYFLDFVHFNELGHKVVAEHISRYVNDELGRE